MKIENYRTQKFRNKVSHIVDSRNHDGEIQKIQYNFDRMCETKPIKINGKSINDCVAYYRVNVTGKDDEYTTQDIYFIDADDLLNLDRSMKLHHFKGDDIIIKSTSKVRTPEKTIIAEGQVYILSKYPDAFPIKIISRTKTTAKYVKCYYTFSEEIMNKYEWINYKNIDSLNADVNCKLEDLNIFDKKDAEIETLRLYNGVWQTSRFYWSASIRDDGKTYSKSYYRPS